MCVEYKQIWCLKKPHIYICKSIGMNILYLKVSIVRNCNVDYSGNLFKLFLEMGKRVKAKFRERKKLLQVVTKPGTISSLSLSAVMTAIKIKVIIGYILSQVFSLI